MFAFGSSLHDNPEKVEQDVIQRIQTLGINRGQEEFDTLCGKWEVVDTVQLQWL